MDAGADVSPLDQSHRTALPIALADALADCPASLLWAELRKALPLDTAGRVFDLATAVARAGRT